MQAIMMTAPGAVDTLQLMEVPEPVLTGPGQVKVRIHAAGVNPIDTKLRSRGVFFDNALPAILGCDGAGEIVQTGAAVSGLQVGDRVWFCHGGLGREPGKYAQFAVLEAAEVRHMPANLDYVQAAAAPLVLLTAWEALFRRAALQAGQRVLVHAGAGGVGHIAIQLARHFGARVATTVSSDAKGEFARSLGAELIINYRQQNFVEAVLAWTDGQGVDVVLDTVGGQVFRDSIPALAHYGALITLLDPGTDIEWKEARNRNLRIGFELMLTPMLRDLPQARAYQMHILDECKTLFETGKLSIHVSHILPLSEAARAHALIEAGGAQGKIVLQVVH